MEIAILNYRQKCVDIIKTAPDMKSDKEIEKYLCHFGYNLNEVDWLIDPEHKRIHINIWKPMYDDSIK